MKKILSAILIVMLALAALPVTPAMAAASTLSPTTTVTNSGVTVATNATTCGMGANTNQGWSSNDAWVCYDNQNEFVRYSFGNFGIPAGSTITDISVSVEGHRFGTSANHGRNLLVSLWNQSDLTGYTGTQTATMAYSATTDGTLVSLPGLWGATWTAADFNSGTFIIQVESSTRLVGSGTNLAFLDHAQVTVTYTPDVTAPVFTSITRQTPAGSPTNANTLTFRALFDEGVQNVTAGDFVVTGTSATVTGVNAVNASTYDITVSGGDLNNLNNTVGLNLAGGQNIQNLAGLALPNTEPATDETYVVDNAGPTVTSLVILNPASTPTNADTLIFRVTFSENVANVSQGDFVVTGTSANVTGVNTVTAFTVYDVTVSGGNLAGLNGTVILGFDITGGTQQNITDTLGNALPNPNNTASYVVDNTVPTVVITQSAGQTDPTSSLPVNFTATFNEAITIGSFVAADITIGGTTSGVKTATITEIAPNNGTTFNVAVNGATGSGIITIAIAANRFQDAAGNTNTAASTNTDNSITYNANTAPTVSAVIADVTVFEDAANTVFSLYPSFADAENTDAQLTFTVQTNSNPGLFTSVSIADPTNFTLDFAPDANGTSNITIRATDTGGLLIEDTFLVTVTAVNDVPSFTKGADETVLEDAGAQTVAGWATAITDGDPELTQTLTFNVTGNTNAGLFSTAPAINATTGDLTYTPAADANGSATITITLSDNGSNVLPSINTSAAQTFVINVTAVNDVPSFTKGADETVNEDAGAQTVAGWATAITDGDPELTQTLTFNVTGNTNASLFSAAPAIDSTTGDLTYTPAASANGSATITITLSDNGGNTLPDVNTSAAQTFIINVTAVNDVPSFTKGADETVNEDAGAQTVAGWATAITDGDPELTQTLTFNVTGNTNAGLFSTAPAIDSTTGDLTYTPAASANGSATITITLSDNGGNTLPDVNTSAAQTFVINVNAVNDVPSFTKGADETVNENAGAQTVAGWATAITDGDPELTQR